MPSKRASLPRTKCLISRPSSSDVSSHSASRLTIVDSNKEKEISRRSRDWQKTVAATGGSSKVSKKRSPLSIQQTIRASLYLFLGSRHEPTARCRRPKIVLSADRARCSLSPAPRPLNLIPKHVTCSWCPEQPHAELLKA